MIVVTGAAGFIGSVLVEKLNSEGHKDIIISDDFSNAEKNRNLMDKLFVEKVHRMELSGWLEKNHTEIDFVFHIGARTDTTEFDMKVFDLLNLNFSKMIWEKCSRYRIPLIYASSAATYGMGEYGYDDDHEIINKLKPLNPYGISKNEFDKWILAQKDGPPFWAGFKFFNVYGPNEYHKGRMASVIYHAYLQITATGKMNLFRSHNPDFEDGKQLRDFVYVKDVVDVLYHFYLSRPEAGIYNLGTGRARTFIDLATSVFVALDKTPDIRFVDTPFDIRDKYQYFTEAKMEKIQNQGYHRNFTSLEEGIDDYIKNYLRLTRFL